ncbi:NADP-dependent oxidoreductase domain-containing protein [Desarmillaria ectypa]|nr:NADP-dependent oxidoreductase domain-containing protein [Desarmillaria ectypa]
MTKIILGCAVYGSSDRFNWVQDEEESIRQIKVAYDAGINATNRLLGETNRRQFLGKAIKEHDFLRDKIVVMTKSYAYRWQGGSLRRFLWIHKPHIFNSVKKRLEHLQLDYVDVLHCHKFDTSPCYVRWWRLGKGTWLTRKVVYSVVEVWRQWVVGVKES